MRLIDRSGIPSRLILYLAQQTQELNLRNTVESTVRTLYSGSPPLSPFVRRMDRRIIDFSLELALFFGCLLRVQLGKINHR